MKTVLFPAQERGSADFGWFQAKYSFSFGDYFNPDKTHFGALRVFNDSVIKAGKGFPEHPHKNFEIITVQLTGTLTHTDVSGTRVIKAGDVQCISAGTGVVHSDLNIGDIDATQFQIWLTPDTQNIAPKSQIAFFDEKERQDLWQTLIAPNGSAETPLTIQQQSWIKRANFTAGKNISYTLKNPNNGIFLMVISGKVVINNEILTDRDAIALSDADMLLIDIITLADLMIIEVPVTV